ncbi:MAG: TolC family protein [bacterium]|nr:TolC family protein [bacterium]
MTKKITHWVLILIVVTGLSFSAHAEEIKSLTLEKAIQIAGDSNIYLKQNANLVSSAKITVKQKKANFLPDLSISATASKQTGKTYDTLSGEYLNDNNETFGLAVSSSNNLFNGFYDKASLKQSRFQLIAAEKNFSRANQSVVFETIQRFVRIITTSEAVGVEKANLKAQQLQLERIEAFSKAGKRPIADLYQQKAEISAAEFRILNAERDYEVSKLLLLETLGLTSGDGTLAADYQVETPPIELLMKKAGVFDKNTEINEAQSKRPDIQAEEMNIEAAKKGVKAAKSGYYPKLSCFKSLGTNYNSLFSYSDFSAQLDGNLNFQVGLSLSIPVFDKFKTKNNVALSRLQLSNQKLELEKAKNRVNVEVSQAIEDYRTARKQIDVTSAQIKYTRAALESVEERYNVNASTMVELIQARTRYLDSTLDELEAKFNLLVRSVALAYYKGDSNGMRALL